MKKVWIISLLLLVSVLCSCTMAGNTQGQQEPAKGQDALQADNLNASRTSDLWEALKKTKTVKISYHGEDLPEITDAETIQSLVNAFSAWDAEQNKAQESDIERACLIRFDDILIRCALHDNSATIVRNGEHGTYHLPQSFLDALAKLVPTESGLDGLYERLKNAKTVTVSTCSYEINGGEGLVVSYDKSIANLANALRDWDAQKNRTEAQDTICQWTVCFDGVEISCSFRNAYSVVRIDSEAYFCYLPEGFYAVLRDWILS